MRLFHILRDFDTDNSRGYYTYSLRVQKPKTTKVCGTTPRV